MIKQFLIGLKLQPIVESSLLKERGYFTELFAVSSGGECNSPVLQTFAASIISKKLTGSRLKMKVLRILYKSQ